jgi:hypothetical protein
MCNMEETRIGGRLIMWDVSYRDVPWKDRKLGWYASTYERELITEGHATRDEALATARKILATKS